MDTTATAATLRISCANEGRATSWTRLAGPDGIGYECDSCGEAGGFLSPADAAAAAEWLANHA